MDPILRALATAAKAVVDSINYDMVGDRFGQGGHGGLVSPDTVKACDEVRRILYSVKEPQTHSDGG